MLLTRNCNYDCTFCIEKTEENTRDNSSLEIFLKKANHLIDKSLVDEVLLLGGEPLYYKNIVEIIDGLHIQPIITTNGYRVLDDSFYARLDFGKLKAMNISVPHYNWNKRKEIIRKPCLSNEELKEVVRRAKVPTRMNVVLMRDYIRSQDEIHKMIEFAQSVGINSIKFGELTGVNKSTHNFVKDSILKYNQSQYCPIPVKRMYDVCHELGGTHKYKTINRVEVLFNSAPDFALSGGKDKQGKYYHVVLFNDGMLGFSWRREDGLYNDENHLLQVAQQNQKLL